MNKVMDQKRFGGEVNILYEFTVGWKIQSAIGFWFAARLETSLSFHRNLLHIGPFVMVPEPLDSQERNL